MTNITTTRTLNFNRILNVITIIYKPVFTSIGIFNRIRTIHYLLGSCLYSNFSLGNIELNHHFSVELSCLLFTLKYSRWIIIWWKLIWIFHFLSKWACIYIYIYIYIYIISRISNKYHVSIERNDSFLWEYMGYNFTIWHGKTPISIINIKNGFSHGVLNSHQEKKLCVLSYRQFIS